MRLGRPLLVVLRSQVSRHRICCQNSLRGSSAMRDAKRILDLVAWWLHLDCSERHGPLVLGVLHMFFPGTASYVGLSSLCGSFVEK